MNPTEQLTTKTWPAIAVHCFLSTKRQGRKQPNNNNKRQKRQTKCKSHVIHALFLSFKKNKKSVTSSREPVVKILSLMTAVLRHSPEGQNKHKSQKMPQQTKERESKKTALCSLQVTKSSTRRQIKHSIRKRKDIPFLPLTFARRLNIALTFVCLLTADKQIEQP